MRFLQRLKVKSTTKSFLKAFFAKCYFDRYFASISNLIFNTKSIYLLCKYIMAPKFTNSMFLEVKYSQQLAETAPFSITVQTSSNTSKLHRSYVLCMIFHGWNYLYVFSMVRRNNDKRKTPGTLVILEII